MIPIIPRYTPRKEEKESDINMNGLNNNAYQNTD